MSKLEEYLDKHYDHPKYGHVQIIGIVENSRTKLHAEIMERGPGYDHQRKKYTGVKKKSGWYLGKNYMYGKTVTVHHKFLTEKKYNEYA